MSRFSPISLACPIVQAPMAGGPSTQALAAAVSGAGGLGFLAAGYKSPQDSQREIDELRTRLADDVSFGVNLFSPSSHASATAEITAYAERLSDEAEHRGVTLELHDGTMTATKRNSTSYAGGRYQSSRSPSAARPPPMLTGCKLSVRPSG